MTITQLRKGAAFVNRMNAGATGSIGQIKRADWIRFMVQFFVENSILPQRALLTGVVERSGGGPTIAVLVRVQSDPPAQTGLGYGDMVYLEPDCIIEHSPSDSVTVAKTEAALAPKPPMPQSETIEATEQERFANDFMEQKV